MWSIVIILILIIVIIFLVGIMLIARVIIADTRVIAEISGKWHDPAGNLYVIGIEDSKLNITGPNLHVVDDIIGVTDKSVIAKSAKVEIMPHGLKLSLPKIKKIIILS